MSNYTLSISVVHQGALISGTQGALFHDNKIYQFRDGGQCQVLDKQFNKLYTFQLPNYADNTGKAPHCSSVEWIEKGKKIAITTNATALVGFADRVYVYDISDLSNITQEIVVLQCTDKTKYARMAAMCYDPVNKVMYVAGYGSGSGSSETSTCWFESFDFSDYIDNGTLSAPLLTQTESDGAGLHLQDGGFHNGYLYYACDHSNTKSGDYDGLFLWVLDTNFNQVALIDLDTTNTYEGEAFYIAPEEHGTKFVLSSCKNAQTYYMLDIHKKNASQDPIKHTVIFLDWNGKVLKDVSVENGQSVSAPTSPSRSGYNFTGWSPSVNTSVTESKVYNAQYSVIATTYTIVFKSWDGSVISSQTLNEGESVTVPSGPARSGYTFTGWSPSVSETATADATYVAQYEASVVKYTISFVDHDGSVISSTEYDENTIITIPGNPTRDGYTFIGWSPSVSNSAVANATYTAQYQEVAVVPDDANVVTLAKSLNVVGYNIDGQEHREDEILITSGTHTVSPIYRSFEENGENLNAIFCKWSDGCETEEREVAIGDEDVELTAYGTMETIYLYGMPAPSTGCGTTLIVGGTASKCHFNLSSNTAYKNEYITATTRRYNDEDRDLMLQDSSNFDANTLSYFAENNIVEGCRFFGAVPSGYKKFNIRVFNGDGEDNTPTSRNPNVFILTGDAYKNGLHKIYGATDVKRPMDASMFTADGLTIDYSAITIANGTTNDYTSAMQAYNLLTMRLLGNAARLNNSIVRIKFIK